ncbi:hypothetical protein HK097_008103 [Rhizophlyctis rosea]|uniref:Uncharacterized protein n=1 Tax=Rhizophlyctis rosea TaxID=64517 RepID=A0AAD5X453_9FUNG|nr:hypothetical protein HK097_008103 [Rhizophlyctis rosea]
MKSTLAFFALAGLAGFAAAQSCPAVTITDAMQTFPYAPTLVEAVKTGNNVGISTSLKETGFANNQLRIAFLNTANVAGRVATWTTSKGCSSAPNGKIVATTNEAGCYTTLAINRADLPTCFTETSTNQNGIVLTYDADLTLKVSDPVTPSTGAPYTRTDSMFYKTTATIRKTDTDINENSGLMDISVTPEFRVMSQKFEIKNNKKYLKIVVQSNIEWPFNLQIKNDGAAGSNYKPDGVETVAVTGLANPQPLNVCPDTPGEPCYQAFELTYEVTNCGGINSEQIASSFASCRRGVLSNDNLSSCFVGDETARKLTLKVQSDNTCSNVNVVLDDFQPDMVLNNDKTSKNPASLLPMTQWYIHILTKNVEAAGLKVTIPNLWITTDITDRNKNKEIIYLIKDKQRSALAKRDWNKFECSNETPGNTYCTIFAGLEDPEYWKTQGALADPSHTGTYGILMAGLKGTYTIHADLEYVAGQNVHLRRRLSARAEAGTESGSASRNVTLDISNYSTQYSHTADSNSSKFPAGAIGGIVGGLVAVGAVVGGGFMYRKKRQQKAAAVATEVEEIKA